MKQLGDGLNVPVRGSRASVTEVRGKLRREAIDVEAGAIPSDEPPRGERMADILKAWATADATTMPDWSQTDGLAPNFANVRSAALRSTRPPRSVTKNAGVSRRGRTVSRSELYAGQCDARGFLDG